MKVLLISNNGFMRGNGVYTALQSQKKHLEAYGHEVRIMSSINPDKNGRQPDYPLNKFYIPFFDKLITTNGFQFARTDRKLIREAVSWADIVHMEEGFPLQVVACNIAHELGKPCVASFHLFAQNIIANFYHGGVDDWLNGVIMNYWRKYIFNKCSHIHCPTPKVKQVLLDNGFTSEMRVFSNGIELPKTERNSKEEQIFGAEQITTNDTSQGNNSSCQVSPSVHPIKLLCIGRLAFEKSQITLFEAMKYSKYASQIQLVFAGSGPMKEKLQRIDRRLRKKGIMKYPASFGFYTHQQLADLVRESYLYLHCAWVEVEGLSCLEALREGIVPIIAEGRYTASSDFALDERSLFPEKNAKVLAQKIDYWIEHPQERNIMAAKYAQSVLCHSVENSTREMIQMYEDAIKSKNELV